MLPKLPRVPQPSGAVAVANQASCKRLTVAPRGMTLDSTCVRSRARLHASPSAALHLGVLLKAYLSTRTVSSAESAQEVVFMLAAEDKELYNASANVCPADGSLAPRPTAVTLLAFGDETHHCNGMRDYLDALAHLAETSISADGGGSALAAMQIRMSVLAGKDAAWFLDEVRAQTLSAHPPAAAGDMAICARWAPPGSASGIRSELATLPAGRSLDECLVLIQNYFLSLKVAYDAPFPSSIARTHVPVRKDAWAVAQHRASATFFALMEGEPCVCKSPTLRANEESVDMQSLHVFLRICPRTVLDPASGTWLPIDAATALTRQDVFHAFLIGNAAFRKEIVDYCLTLPPEGMAADVELAHWCLHTCAVQANSFALRENVSLYATHPLAGSHRPGMPICSPGSWIWRLESAIVPVEMVVQNFYVVPCHRDSLPPGDRRLERPFDNFFSRAYRLFTDTFGATGKTHGEDFERLPCAPDVVTSAGDVAVREAEEYALTAFGIDAGSKRISVGDAYAFFVERRAPQTLTNFMLQSSLRYGIDVSLLDAMDRASAAIASDQAHLAARACDEQRMRRLADAALRVSAGCKRHRPEDSDMKPARVKALLEACGLCADKQARMPVAKDAGSSEYSDMVQVVGAQVLTSPASSALHRHACEAARGARSRGELSSIAVAITVLRSAHNAVKGTLYIISQEAKDGAVGFGRVDCSGSLEKVTPGAIVDTPVRSVLLCKYNAKGMRITATVQHAHGAS